MENCNKQILNNFLLIFYFLFSSLTEAQNINVKDSLNTKLTLKKNRFLEIKIGAVNGFANKKTTDYILIPEQGGNLYTNLKIYHSNFIALPQSSISYSFKLLRKTKNKNNFFMKLGVAHSYYLINTIQIGEYGGGVTQFKFKGTINEQLTKHFIDFYLGCSNNIKLKYFLINVSSGIAFKNQIYNKIVHTEVNTLPGYRNNNYAQKHFNIPSFTIYELKRRNFKPLLIFDFDINVYESVNKNRLGIFIGYSFTNYSFNQNIYRLDNYDFFKKYKLLRYGLIYKI
jgi:hypothetical protein